MILKPEKLSHKYNYPIVKNHGEIRAALKGRRNCPTFEDGKERHGEERKQK